MKGHFFRDMRHACRKRSFSGHESQQVSRRLIFELMLHRLSAPEITIRYFHYSLIRNRHFCITKPWEDRNDLLFLPTRAPQIGWQIQSR